MSQPLHELQSVSILEKQCKCIRLKFSQLRAEHESAFSTEEQPAFYHSYEYVRGHKLGIIKLNPVVSDRMAKESVREALHPRHLPMLVQPKRWVSYNEGGYLYNKGIFVFCLSL
jgi:DNA-directed RNA polymerase